MKHQGPVWLFDDICVLCSTAVRYVLKHEYRHDIKFVAIRSPAGRSLALAHDIGPDSPETFLFIENGEALRRSAAVLSLLRHAGGPAQYLRLARFLPVWLLDWLYDRLARHRYRIFGKLDVCPISDPAVRHRVTLSNLP